MLKKRNVYWAERQIIPLNGPRLIIFMNKRISMQYHLGYLYSNYSANYCPFLSESFIQENAKGIGLCWSVIRKRFVCLFVFWNWLCNKSSYLEDSVWQIPTPSEYIRQNWNQIVLIKQTSIMKSSQCFVVFFFIYLRVKLQKPYRKPVFSHLRRRKPVKTFVKRDHESL